MHILEEKFLKNKSLLQNKNILVGLSGGADSVALLYLLNKYQKKLNIKIAAAHFNHQWRESASLDEQFCKDLCNKLNIKIFIDYALNYPTKNQGSEEANAREKRILFFNKFTDYHLALAHHQDDQIENFFIRIIRGTSIDGLTGIKKAQKIKEINILRPFLDVNKNQIQEFCKQENLDFVTDPTNLDNKYLRNKIRNKLIPILDETDKRYSKNIINLLDKINSAQNFIDQSTDRIFTDNKINLKEWRNSHKYLQDEAIKKLLIINNFTKPITSKLISEIARFFNSTHGGQHKIRNDFVIIKKQNNVFITNRQIA